MKTTITKAVKRAVLVLAGMSTLLASSASWAYGYTYVQPYFRGDGTAVQGHLRSNPDGNPYNNLR